MSRRTMIIAGVTIGAIATLIVGSVAFSETSVDSMPNCSERWHAWRTPNETDEGFPTAEEAADEVRQSVIDGGGRADGATIERLVQLDDTTFYLPVPNTPGDDADWLIEVSPGPRGGFLATHAVFCPDTVPDPLPWGLEE